jgi:hypothetical protein
MPPLVCLRGCHATPVRPALVSLRRLRPGAAPARQPVRARRCRLAAQPRARLLDARRAELAALAEVAAGSLPGPGTVGISHRNDRLQSDRGRLEWELEYAQPLWLPGQAEARRQEADTALRALEPSVPRCAWGSPAA